MFASSFLMDMSWNSSAKNCEELSKVSADREQFAKPNEILHLKWIDKWNPTPKMNRQMKSYT